MVGLRSLDELRGESLARWLDLSARDMVRLAEQMAQREAATVLTTGLRPEHSRARAVEVIAVAVPGEADACWGFSISARPRLN
jgi:hypothetical protein